MKPSDFRFTPTSAGGQPEKAVDSLAKALRNACSSKHPDSGPPVPRKALVCTNCGRSICEWHSAQSPVAVDGEVRLVTVCHPSPCDGPFWNPPHSKGRAA